MLTCSAFWDEAFPHYNPTVFGNITAGKNLSHLVGKGGLGRKGEKDLLILALGLDFSKQEKLIDGGFTRDPLGTAESAMQCGLQSAIPAHSAAHVWFNSNLIYFSGNFSLCLDLPTVASSIPVSTQLIRERLSLLKWVIRKCYSSCCFDLPCAGMQPTVQPLLRVAVGADEKVCLKLR